MTYANFWLIVWTDVIIKKKWTVTDLSIRNLGQLNTWESKTKYERLCAVPRGIWRVSKEKLDALFSKSKPLMSQRF